MNLNNKDLANDYLNESKLRMETAQFAFNKKAYAFCIRQSQEAVKLSLKATLRLIGIDFPKWHDVSEVLVKVQEKYPDDFQQQISKLAEISSSLTKKRELAMYGDEATSLPPSKIFNEKDATTALKNALFSIEHVEELFQELQDTLNTDKAKEN